MGIYKAYIILLGVAQVVNNLIQAKVGHRDSGNGVVWLLKRKWVLRNFGGKFKNSNK